MSTTMLSTKANSPARAAPARASPVAVPVSGRGRGVQAELRISQPSDPLEHEADRVADRVMRMSAGTIARACTCDDDDDGNVLRAPASTPPTTAAGTITRAALGLPAAGHPLPTHVRNWAEPAFGADLSTVRVHDGDGAGRSADRIGARAYTLGNDIVFAPSHYRPDSSQGRRLLAHELTHVVQQRRSEHEGGHGGTSIQRDCSDPNFCEPLNSFAEVTALQQFLRTVWLPVESAKFGDNSRALFESFLNRRPGDSLAPVVFNDPASDVVDSFATSSSTDEDQDAILDLIGSRLSRAPGPNRDDTPAMMSISNFLSPAEMDNRPINYSNPLSIAGHIAGGIGSSDAGDDVRKVRGNATLERVTFLGSAAYTKVDTTLHYEVFDAIDFCPGDCGSPAEQLITVPMSRLEASGQAYDVPFKVEFSPESRTKRFT